MNPNAAKVIVVGAGAAGLTAAIFTSQSGANVLLLERTDKTGKKILMSGGTRCNVLPVEMELTDYITSSSDKRMRNIFRSWNLKACKEWFEDEIGLQLACEVDTNKWFPVSNSAKEVRNVLLSKAQKVGVQIRYECAVDRIETTETGFLLHTKEGETFTCSKVIVSTGGFSIPSIGTDGMGHRFMKKMGHKTDPVYAALTPLTGSDQKHHALSGLSLNVSLEVWQDNKKLASSNRTGFLFTHRGYSGPAVLDVSHHAVKALESGEKIPEYRVNWTGESREVWEKRLIGSKMHVHNLLKEHLPNRLAEWLSEELNLSQTRLPELKKEDRKKLLHFLTAYPLPINGHEGYKKAEVTGGGIPLEEINTATLESAMIPGLYLCGEILDVFGRIGGFNFYWAWLTGRLAGMNAGK